MTLFQDMFTKARETVWRFIVLRYTTIVLFLCLFVYFFSYLAECHGPRPVRSDGQGYYAYLPAFFIHRDMSFETAAQLRDEGKIVRLAGINPHPETGRHMNRYNLGVAVMMAPFFGAAHVTTWMLRSPPGAWHWWKLNYPMDGYSLFYQHAAGLAGLFYMILGLMVLRRELERLFPEPTAILTLTLLLLGTNLLNYGTGDCVTAHPYSFFLFSLFLRMTRVWHEQPTIRSSVWIGLIAGLITLVRTNNAIFLVVFPLYGVMSLDDMRRKIVLYWSGYRHILVIGCFAFLVFSPQFVFWKYATGRWLTYSYGDVGFNFLSPQIWGVLFSLRGGIFFWSPILVLAFLGVWTCRRLAPQYVWCVVAYMALHIYLVASWEFWAFGGGFGHRAFVESYALLAFPLAAFLASVKQKQPVFRVGVVLFCVVAVVWSLFLMKLYYTREMSYDGLDRAALFDIFWWRKNVLLDWWSAR